MLGSCVTATSYTTSISTIPTPVKSGLLNWNRTPPALYSSLFCKLCPLIPPPLFQFIFHFRWYSHLFVQILPDIKMSVYNCFGWSLAPYTIFTLAHAILVCRLPPITHSIQLAFYFLGRSKPPLGYKMLICMSVVEVLCLLREFYCPPPPPPSSL